MYRLRLSIALALLVALVCCQAAFVYLGANRVDDYARHSRLTSDILSELLELSASKQRLRVWASQQLMGAGAAPDTRDRLLASMRASAARLAQLSQRHLQSWQEIAARERGSVPPQVQQLVDIGPLLDENILELQAQLQSLQPLPRGGDFAGVWQHINQVFDTTHGRDLRELVNGAIERQRSAVPLARGATERGLDRLRTQAVAMAAITLLAAIAWGIHLNRRLKQPLGRLLDGARALQSGALTHRIPLGSGDEFDQVARRFNAMAEELQHHREEAEAARRQLEEAVRARTLELETAHKTLQSLDQRRRQLFADLSHELRTPATAIRGEAEIALRGGDKAAADYRETLVRIVGAVKQLTGVVDDLLLVARSEADQLVIRFAPLSLATVVAEAAAQAQALAALHGMQLDVDLPPATLTVQADAERLRQALVILIDNAIRYSHPRGRIRLGWQQAGSEVQLDVRDQGIGIDPQDLPRVFERFNRGRRAREHRADGTGIGLSIAQAILHAHHGSIVIDSVPGVGTSARIVLTCSQDQAATIAA